MPGFRRACLGILSLLAACGEASTSVGDAVTMVSEPSTEGDGQTTAPAAAEGVTCGNLTGVSTGLRTLELDGVQRQYHVRVPPGAGPDLPLVVAFHGTGGSADAWIDDSYYNLESAVGEGAWLIYPNALPGNDGKAQWDQRVAVRLFDAIVAELEGCFDANQVFVTGHSSGGGMAHLLACERGDVVRGAAPVSGILLSDRCLGQAAIFQIHGAADELVPASTGEPGKDYWAARAGCDLEAPIASLHGQCESYDGCDEGFAVHWCEHTEALPPGGQGHDWPPFAGQAVWAFFQGLDTRVPDTTSPDRDPLLVGEGDTLATFSLAFPQDLIGTPEVAAASFYAPGTEQPLTGAPLHLIALEFDVGPWSRGSTVDYEVVLNTGPVEPGAYTFAVNVYMEGSTYPIPQAEHDYVGLVEVTFAEGEPLVIEAPIALSPVQAFGAGDNP